MARESVARHYAQALFELARERDELETARHALEGVARAAAGDRRWRWLTESPVLSPASREAALDLLLQEDVSPLVRRFLHVLVRKGRGTLLPAVVREFGRLADEAEGIREAEVTTSMPLDQESREALQRRLEAWTEGRVRLRERVDPSILGGLIVRVGDRRLDGSVRSRLEEMRRHLAGAAAGPGIHSGQADEKGGIGR